MLSFSLSLSLSSLFSPRSLSLSLQVFEEYLKCGKVETQLMEGFQYSPSKGDGKVLTVKERRTGLLVKENIPVR